MTTTFLQCIYYKLILTDVEDIQLSTEERCFYEERFDMAVIAFNQLEMAETIGEGKIDS